MVKTKLFRGLFVVLLIVSFCLPPAPPQNFCGMTNTAFQAGESITYKIYYTLGVFIEAGQVNFGCAIETFNGKPVYHFTAVGNTIPFYDNFYKVRDRYESYVDTATLQPYKFMRSVSEGDVKKYENISFNQATKTVITNGGVYQVPDCVQDVLSAMYYARNLRFDSAKNGDKIPFSMFLENKLYPSYIRYLGKENIKTKFGRFHAIKFKPLLIKGTMFDEGEKMTVWVSDDANHVPLRVESSIAVGSVKADMMGYKNLRMPLSSQIQK